MIPLVVLAVITNTDDVRTCSLSSDGALVGTSGGLVHGSAVITASDGLPGTRIDAVLVDGKRAVIGTDGGVAELDLATDTISHATVTKPVRDLAKLGGKLYAATWDGGVVEVGKDALAMTGGKAAERMRVSSLAVADGVLYAGTQAGVYALRDHRFSRVDSSPTEIASLAADGETLYVATPTGLSSRRGGTFHALGGGDVRRVAVIDGKVVLAGDAGLQIVDGNHVIALPGAPKVGVALAIGGDAAGMCAGGLDGLWTEANGTWTHAPMRGGLPSNDISALAADGDTLWVGTFDHGLARYDGHTWHAVAGVDARINALAVAPDAIWIGTAEGVAQIDRSEHVLATYSRRDGIPGRSALAVAVLHDGRVAVGSSSGAALIDRGRVSRVGPHGEPAIGNVWAIAEGDDGSLWLGAVTGLYHGPAQAWTAKDGGDAGTWERRSVASGDLRDDWVTSIVVSHDTVWAGTYKGGVAQIDRGTVTQLDGGWVNPGGLSRDGDQLVAATMDGLVVRDGTSWRAVAKLPGRDTTAIAYVGRTMWVATRRGLYAR